MTFDEARWCARVLLAAAEGELGPSGWEDGAGPTPGQVLAVREARELIAQARAVLDQAVCRRVYRRGRDGTLRALEPGPGRRWEPAAPRAAWPAWAQN